MSQAFDAARAGGAVPGSHLIPDYEPTCSLCGKIFRSPEAIMIGMEMFHAGCVRRAIRENRIVVENARGI